MQEWPTPKSVTEVQSFLGLAGYYRRFVRSFSDVARPLHRLTEKGQEFQWGEDCEVAFQELKQRLQEAPILAFPEPDAEYIMDTDASDIGVGAVLSQVIDGQERVIAYGSRVLSKPERNYCVTRKELLAIVVFLKKFRQYLYGRRFIVRSDHGSLRWLMNFKDPQGQLSRWLQVISEYDLTIVHRPGRSQRNADSLSRRPCPQCGRKEEETTNTTRTGDRSVGVETGNSESPAVRIVALGTAETREAWRKAQEADVTTGWILKAKSCNSPRPEWSTMSSTAPAMKQYWLLWDQIDVKEGVLCKRWESDDGRQVRHQVIVPQAHRKEVVDELHGGPTGGHLGQTKTLAKVRQRFYWCGVDADVRSYVRQCAVCASKKSPAKARRAPLQQYSIGTPMQRVALDILGPLPETNQGNKYVLVVGDYFTKWVEAYPIPDEKAETVARTFVSEFVCKFGVPVELHSDQGRNFESRVFSEVCSILGIRKTRTTPYNPKSDGMIERFNRTLLGMVSSMIDPLRRQRDWDEQLAFATFAYRATPQESTGESPNMLMLGREVSLPLDLTTRLSTVESEANLTEDYALRLRETMQSAHERAREHLKASARRQKKTYDRKTMPTTLEAGQLVWLHNPSKRRGLSPKLQRRWEGPCRIVDKLSDVTYRIQRRPSGR